MKRVRTTEVIIERDEVFVVRRPPARAAVRCEACGGAELVSPETAAVLGRTTTRTLYRLVEAGLVHFAETPEGLLFVCLRSLRQEARPPAAPARLAQKEEP